MLNPEFPHLLLLQRRQGLARLEGGGASDDRVVANQLNRQNHADHLIRTFGGVAARAQQRNEERKETGLPPISGGTPFLLQIPQEDESTMEYLAEKLGLEIVAEYDSGYLIVATQDLDVSTVLEAANGFAQGRHGTGALARILEIDEDPSSEGRLRRILGEELWPLWPFADDADLTFDVSIESAVFGAPPKPRITSRTRPEVKERKQREYDEALRRHQVKWDDKRIQREDEIEIFVDHYGGEIVTMFDESHVVDFPDSFSARIKMSGLGFKDLIINYPNIFEIVIPDEVEEPVSGVRGDDNADTFELLPPPDSAPTVCVIDSGIQEGHRWLNASIKTGISQCFIPGVDSEDIADYVTAGGHGTRVAGATLYPNMVPEVGSQLAPFWIANARVLDNNGKLIQKIYPPELLREVVDTYAPQGVRIYNHSIASDCCCRTSRMSAWAATMDLLSFDEDALFFQAAGNLKWRTNGANRPGVLDHYDAGRTYPDYLYEGSSRIANPGQSLQAITVGSISGDLYEDDDRKSLSFAEGPSTFSRTGLGLWDSIKPEVVEFGGDDVATKVPPLRLSNPPAVCPHLIRSTFTGGPAHAKDCTGTSFSAPKVTHIAGQLAALFPDRSTQLYRALIVNSARWPDWMDRTLTNFRSMFVRSIGFGVPDLVRATENTTNRVTLITDAEFLIRAKEGLVFGVPVPEELRRPGGEFTVRIDVTLAYVAEPRRTRKGRRGYLSVWLDWKASKRNEKFEAFLARALKDSEEEDGAEEVSIANFPWVLGNAKERDGATDGVSRRNGTVQKDWAFAKSYDLPDIFGIVVRGHEGWAHRIPEAAAKFSLVVSFEVIGADIPVYEAVREAIEAELAELDAEASAEVRQVAE